MSKIYSSDVASIDALYSIADALKKLNQNVKVSLKFKQKSHLDLFNLYGKQKILKHNREEEQSDVESADESVDDKDVEEEELESGESSNYSFKARVDDTSRHAYQLTKLKVFILKATFQKQIKRLEQQFGCRVILNNDQCTIQGKNIQFKEVVERLRDLLRSILIEKAKDNIINSLRHSQHLKQILEEMRINVHYDGHSYSYWAQKEDMTHEEFSLRISEVENNVRTRLYFCPKKKFPIAFNQIVKRFISPKLQYIEKLYELKIETGPFSGLIIHAQTLKIAQTVEEQVKNIVSSIIVFSINLQLSKVQESQLHNYITRKCPQVRYKLDDDLVYFALWKTNSKKNIKRIERFLEGSAIRVSRNSKLTIFTSLYKPNIGDLFLKQIEDFQCFRQAEVVDWDLVVSGAKIMESDGSPKEYIQIVKKFQEFLIKQGHQPPETEETAEAAQLSQSAMDMSSSYMTAHDTSSAHVIQSKNRAPYSLTYPFKIQVKQMESLYEIGKKDNLMQQFIQKHVFLQSRCRQLIYSSSAVLPKLSSECIFVTSQNIPDNDMPQELRIREVRSELMEGAKYIVQADINQSKVSDGEYTVKKGQFIVSHKLVIIQ